jgi:hypothetical protein
MGYERRGDTFYYLLIASAVPCTDTYTASNFLLSLDCFRDLPQLPEPQGLPFYYLLIASQPPTVSEGFL